MGASSICPSIYNMFHPFNLERMLWHSTSFKGNMTSNEKASTCIMLSQWGRILASKPGGGPNFEVTHICFLLPPIGYHGMMKEVRMMKGISLACFACLLVCFGSPQVFSLLGMWRNELGNLISLPKSPCKRDLCGLKLKEVDGHCMSAPTTYLHPSSQTLFPRIQT